MAIKRPARKTQPDQSDIDRVIDGGGSPPPKPETQVAQPKERITFQMVLDADLCALLDEARAMSKTSRRAWLTEAAVERLRKEGRIT